MTPFFHQNYVNGETFYFFLIWPYESAQQAVNEMLNKPMRPELSSLI